jgi:Zn-dependent metalloprotease
MGTGFKYYCVCCALPSHLLRHIADKASSSYRAALLKQEKASNRIRGQRAARTAQASRQSPKGGTPGVRRSVFDARGRTVLPGTLARQEGAGPSTDSTVNHAYDNVGITLDFYVKVLGRNSIDGRGMQVDSSVHYGEQYANAMWTGEEMVFGDGDGVHVMGFAQSLDIVAHELTHAVTQHSIVGGLGQVHLGRKVQLVGQAGAFNESLSDVFASMVKQWHAGEDVNRADWLLGEGVLAPSLGKAVRSLKNPGNSAYTYDGDNQVKEMPRYIPDGDVHVNSGIPNHAFYLAAAEIGGQSWKTVGPIWYHAMQTLKSDATFSDAANATVAAAAKLFGTASRERKAVTAGWRKVKVIK